MNFSLSVSLESAMIATHKFPASHRRRFFIPIGGENTDLFESPQKAELRTKSARLVEPDAEQNMDQQSATVKSYQRAIDSTQRNMSRQTVHNRLVVLDDIVKPVERSEETPKTLDIFVDEDYVHLMPKGKAIVPLATITEGMDMNNPERHETIEPIHVSAFGMSAEAFRENVVAVLTERYDLDKVKQINVHGDGHRGFRHYSNCFRTLGLFWGWKAQKCMRPQFGRQCKKRTDMMLLNNTAKSFTRNNPRRRDWKKSRSSRHIVPITGIPLPFV